MVAAALPPVRMTYSAPPDIVWRHPQARPPQKQQQPTFTTQQEPLIPIGMTNANKLDEEEEEEEERSAQEEMFPKGKTAELQKSIDRMGESFIGKNR